MQCVRYVLQDSSRKNSANSVLGVRYTSVRRSSFQDICETAVRHSSVLLALFRGFILFLITPNTTSSLTCLTSIYIEFVVKMSY